MPSADLQALCELGQRQLMEMDYLSAEATLAGAEQQAWDARDCETLSRLYMPLQEARRQRRQRCGEGTVHLGLFAKSPSEKLSAQQIIQQYPFGQLLIAGWETIEPAVQFRRLVAE